MLSKSEALKAYTDSHILSPFFIELSKVINEAEFQAAIKDSTSFSANEVELQNHDYTYSDLLSYIHILANPSAQMKKEIWNRNIRPQYCSDFFFDTLNAMNVFNNPAILKSFMTMFYLEDNSLKTLLNHQAFNKNLLDNMKTILTSTGNFNTRDAFMYKNAKKKYHQKILKLQQKNIQSVFSSEESNDFYQFLKNHPSFPNEKQIISFFKTYEKRTIHDDELIEAINKSFTTINLKYKLKQTDAKESETVFKQVSGERFLEKIKEFINPEHAYSVNPYIIPCLFKMNVIKELLSFSKININAAFTGLSDTLKLNLYKGLKNEQDKNLFLDLFFNESRINSINFFNLYEITDFTKHNNYYQNGKSHMMAFFKKQIENFNLKEEYKNEKEIAYFFQALPQSELFTSQIVSLAFRKLNVIINNSFGDEDFFERTQDAMYSYIHKSFNIDLNNYKPLQYMHFSPDSPVRSWLEKQELHKELNHSQMIYKKQTTNRI